MTTTSSADQAVTVSGAGGPEVLRLVDCAPAEPGRGEVRVRQHAIGLNFVDIYYRTGLYSLPAPFIPGVEGAGLVEAIGEGVTGLAVGDRVAYTGLLGGYAATRLIPAWRALRLPDAITFDHAGASLLRAFTVHMLFTRTFPVAAGDTLLVHAAAGGLGALLTGWARRFGATVIGTASSPERAEAARAHGANHVVIGRDADIVAAVMNITNGRGVDFAIDGIGGSMLEKTLGCVRPFGTVASIGQAAGPIPPIAVEALGPRRSLVLARPSVMAYTAERETYEEAGRSVLAMLASGLSAAAGQAYALCDVVEAHHALEEGRIVGGAILRP